MGNQVVRGVNEAVAEALADASITAIDLSFAKVDDDGAQAHPVPLLQR